MRQLNVPAPYVACNVAALCELPKKSIWSKIFNTAYDPVPLRKSCLYAFRMLNEKLCFNTMLFVEDADLWKFAESMIDHHDLPIQQMFHMPSWDAYIPIRSAYTLEGILWYGEPCPLPTAECHLVPDVQDDNAWYAFIDWLGSNGH